MGLLNKLQNQGSILSIADGGAVPVNPLATRQSKLHANGNLPGYSLNGSNVSEVNAQYHQYIDGVSNPLPQPSRLDMNGSTPSQYINNLPG